MRNSGARSPEVKHQGLEFVPGGSIYATEMSKPTNPGSFLSEGGSLGPSRRERAGGRPGPQSPEG